MTFVSQLQDPKERPINSPGICSTNTQLPVRPNAQLSTIIHSTGNIIHTDIRPIALAQQVLQIYACGIRRRPIVNHLHDFVPWTRRQQRWRRAGSFPLVRLHEAWIRHAEGGGLHADAAMRFLHDDGKYEARVDGRGGGDLNDGFVEVCGLLWGVVAKFVDEGVLVEEPPGGCQSGL